MATGSDNNIGQEVFNALYAKELTSPEKKCIAHTHWSLLKLGFKCIGSGDAKEISDKDVPSELLPTDWQVGPPYSLRYLLNGKLFIFNMNIMDSDAIISIIRGEDMKVISVAYPLEKSDDSSRLTSLLRKELEIFVPSPPKVGNRERPEVYRFEPRSRSDPLGVSRPGPPFFNPDIGGIGGIGVGRTDLDPLGRYGPMGPSGMNLVPPHGGFPGIRYDPIMPGEIPRRFPPGPDPDHFKPPDYSGSNYFG